MFRYFNNSLSKLAATLIGCLLLSTSVNAATIWAVMKGADQGTNSPGSPLMVMPGPLSIDLYMDVLSDTSYGWNFDLNVLGIGTVSNLTGPTVNPAFGSALPNGGRKQIGGDVLGETGQFLALSFDFLGEAGAAVLFSGSFTNSAFIDEAIAPTTLLEIQAVPLPGAVWLLGSALVALVGFGRRKSGVA